MRHRLNLVLVLLTCFVTASPIVARQARSSSDGYVILRSNAELIDELGIGPGVCFGPKCPVGTILRRNGSGALVRLSQNGMEEIAPFRFDQEAFRKLAVRAASIRHRGLPCTLQFTDGGGASIFWSMGRQRIEIGFTHGCPNKDDALVLAFYNEVVGVAEVRTAIQKYEQQQEASR